jgi:hypothetical protein
MLLTSCLSAVVVEPLIQSFGYPKLHNELLQFNLSVLLVTQTLPKNLNIIRDAIEGIPDCICQRSACGIRAGKY